MGSKKGIKHKYWSAEIKLEAVNKHLIEHRSMLDVSEEYGINSGMLSSWVKKYLDEGEDGLITRHGNHYAALHTSKSLSEIERLRLTVTKQEVEIARLKKGYYVKGVGANKEYVTGKEKTTK